LAAAVMRQFRHAVRGIAFPLVKKRMGEFPFISLIYGKIGEIFFKFGNFNPSKIANCERTTLAAQNVLQPLCFHYTEYLT
jgi:hypothetical protein